MEKDKEGKKIISIDLDNGDDETDDAHLSSNTVENANTTPEGSNANTTPKKNKKMTKALKDILTNNNTKFMSNFDPELSNRERRKLTRKLNGDGKKNGAVHDENGTLNGSDLCDCLVENCPGCHFPCPKCRSCKCGVDCRVSRKWAYESIENEAEVADAKTSPNPS